METVEQAAATADAAREPSLADLLKSVPEFTAGTDLAAFVTGLVVDAGALDKNGRDALVNANVRRFRIGQAWVASMPKKRADREAWMRAQGEVHELGLTRVRQILRSAASLDKALSVLTADRLPIAVLDRRLETIPAAVKAVLDGRGLDEPATKPRAGVPTTPEARRQALATRVAAAIKAIYSGHEAEVPAALKAITKPAGAARTKRTNPASRPRHPSEPGGEEPRLGPVMQCAGGKSRIAPLLAEVLGNLPPDAELREPYCGGASVSIHMLLTKRATKVWLNDLDPVVQAVWNAVIQEPDALCRGLDGIVHGPAQFKDLRKSVNSLALPLPDLAAAAIYCQRMAFNSGHKGEFRTDLQWDVAVAKERVHETHELLRGKVVHGCCTGLDAREVIRAPGQAVLFLDPPYWLARHGMYRKHYRAEAEFHALAEALRHDADGPNHPWVMTIGDDEVSDRMVIPGARIHRIRSGLQWKKTKGRMSAGHDGSPGWLLDLDRDDAPKRELLITSDAFSERWGLPQLEPALWEDYFGEGTEGPDVTGGIAES